MGSGGQVDDFPPPLPLSPNPDGGDLVLTTICYADPEHTRGERHEVVLHENWTVSVPHDLDAERVMIALGGYLSCLGLVELAAPATELYLRRQVRADPPDITRSVGGAWYIRQRVKGCCVANRRWDTPQEAAEHWRSAEHVAKELCALPSMLEDFAGDVLRAWGLKGGPPPHAQKLVKQQVVNSRDMHELWEAGFSPDLIVALHASVGATTPLPLAFYLGTVTRRPRLGWIRATAERVPERADFTWLSWSETAEDRRDIELRGTWLRLGVPKPDIALLTGSTYGPDDVLKLADMLGRSPNHAASILTACLRAGCSPQLASLAEVLALSDANPSVLTRGALNRLEAAIDMCASRHEVALALLLCGSAAIAKDVVLATGSLDPAELRRGLDEWEQRRTERLIRGRT